MHPKIAHTLKEATAATGLSRTTPHGLMKAEWRRPIGKATADLRMGRVDSEPDDEHFWP
jgi:hypothetical protein